MRAASVAAVDAAPLDAALREPFEIAGGASTRLRNVLVRVRLSDGTVGWGEGAPFEAFNGETQADALRGLRRAARAFEGADAAALRPLLEKVEEALPGQGAARAALGLALADAWCRRARVPLRWLFGGAGARLHSDVTIALVPPDRAGPAARSLWRRGVRTLKLKIGRDLEEDEARVRAVAAAAPRARLLLDANQGYTARRAVELLRRLRRAGIEPRLFEQPVPRGDWDGLREVERRGRVPVAADESVCGRRDAAALVRRRACSVVNLKLMKAGLLEAWDAALIARAAGLELMIGGMVESPLAMAGAAHLAAGLGGFSFVDLDTALWLAERPMTGVAISPAGRYDLSGIRAGIGVRPRAPLKSAA